MAVEYRLLRSDEEDCAVAFWMRVLEMSDFEARQTFATSPMTRSILPRHKSPSPQMETCWRPCAPGGARSATSPVPPFRLVTVSCGDRAGGDSRPGPCLSPAGRHVAGAAGGWLRLGDLECAGNGSTRVSARGLAGGAAEFTGAARSRHRLHLMRSATALRRMTRGQPARAGSPLPPRMRTPMPGKPAASFARPPTGQATARDMFGLYLDEYGAVLLTVQDGETTPAIRGYALVTFSEYGFDVSELAVDPDEPAILASLLQGIAVEAQHRSVPLSGQVMIGVTQQRRRCSRRPLAQRCTASTTQRSMAMCRLWCGRSSRDRNPPFQAPAGLVWPLDAY